MKIKADKIVSNIKQIVPPAPMKACSQTPIMKDGGAEIAAAYSKAGLNIAQKTENLIKNLQSLFEDKSILASGELIHRPYLNGNRLYMNIGDEIKGLKGLYNENKKACAYFLPEGKLDKVFVQSQKTGEIDVLDYVSSTLTHYTKSDVDALHYYKYHPDSIHSKLRVGKDLYSGSMQEETEKTISTLTNLFKDKSKVFVNSEDKVLYRAMQSELSEAELRQLTQVGEVFTEKSFCSTTSNFNVAKRFSSNSPIMEIEFPKGAEFIDIEKMFNIDRGRWREAEYLLDRGSKFVVKGFDPEANIVRVKYLGIY